MVFNRLKRVVEQNSLLWGEEVAKEYHGAAAQDMEWQWKHVIEPLLQRHPIDYSRTFDFACGYGRNTDYLLALSSHVTMIDVNPHNVEYCEQKYLGNSKVSVVQCNGYDLHVIPDGAASFLYTFDSMVHFPPELIKSYLPEFFRVMKPGAHAFVHHSNYTAGGPKADFRQNPHWRNYMSAQLFAKRAKKAGFTISEQTLLPWELPDLDCLTVLRKP